MVGTEAKEFSNEDVIIGKPGVVVRKTFRVINLLNSVWPVDTKIVTVTEGLCFERPELKLPEPGGIVDISVKIWIPEDS